MSSVSSSGSLDYQSSETFAGALMRQINKDDVCAMVHTQSEMLSRFEKTNEMLINFNILSANRFSVTSQEFKKHTALMYDMKKDLDTIFKRIRVLKQRLGKMYPESFKVCGDVFPVVEADQEEEDDQFDPVLTRLNQSDPATAGPNQQRQGRVMSRTTSEHSSLAKRKNIQQTNTEDPETFTRNPREKQLEPSKSEDNIAKGRKGT